MFEELRAAFRQAIANFNRELHRDQVPETMDRLLAGMQREIVDAKALVSELESQVERARREARAEAEQADVCRRREEMARRIDDTETADLAAQYADRHTKRQALLEQKVAALDEELAFRRKDAEEMLARIKEARTEREGLTAQTGRTQARQSLDDADDLFSQLDRMAEKIEGERHAADAAEEMGDLDLDRPSDYHIEIDRPPAQPPDVDAALAELKRRMKKES